ncbi:L,D-transpeptidase family protein [Nubsella zeaxanthinifaciens]|jgi:murein L,D-transpeptidase YcbB/YkuD|uniref:L,D-transpeptidase family protein n=1 Tax=Nubsella zeaxanthinifaciens TaxID=392412 RepID=UPI000DE23672|nr:L,D-transpeptidase family protein [Nubsella zeaxanthinifaciens]
MLKLTSGNFKKAFVIALMGSVLSACSWFKDKPEIAQILTNHFDNKLYDKFDTAAYIPIFKAKLKEQSQSFLNPKVIEAYYQKNEYLPKLVTQFYVNGQLDTLKNFISQSKADGFNPEVFNLTAFEKQLQTLNRNKFNTIEEVYALVADLELTAANSLNKYTNFMGYGSINPRNFFNRFYAKIKRPDSLLMDSVLNTKSLSSVLNDVQPKNRGYLSLKAALAHYRDSLGNDDDPAIKTIKINLERLRWRLPQQTDELVVVNIPDFTLTWFKNDDTLAHMNVCVGGKREATYAERMKAFLKSGKLDDKPKNHETPQLFSVFNAIQVNPIWNIPVSIAKSEIYWMARKDPYYLSNNNIKVYYKGKLVNDPDTINWNKYPREKLPFQFKQGSGEGNALGKFKFVFDNSSSIYLHDTNNKYGFKLANRAISHGCVRIEDPLKFAELMVKDKYQYDKLRMDVDLPPIDTTKNEVFKKKLAMKTDTLKVFQLKPTWYSPRKNIGVYIAYYTAWADSNGKVQFRPDVYDYDPILWKAIERYL